MSDQLVLASRDSTPSSRRAMALLTAIVLVLAWAGLVAAPAKADTAPVGGLPATVSADALPTVQVNGMVWAQATVGNTVYATGGFTQPRPAGAAAGVSQTAQGNILAYDITTGKLITTFSHSLNAQGMVLSVSPDGSTVYVGGDFTTVDGLTRGHIAAFSTATGALNRDLRACAQRPGARDYGQQLHRLRGRQLHDRCGVNRSRLAAFSRYRRADDLGAQCRQRQRRRDGALAAGQGHRRRPLRQAQQRRQRWAWAPSTPHRRLVSRGPRTRR